MKQEEISFVELIMLMWKKKILVILITIISIAIAIGAVIFINSGREKYTLTFDLLLENSFETNTSNIQFNHREIVTKERLENIKNSDPSYNGMNIERILEENYIYVNQYSVEKNKYDVVIYKKALSNKNTAKKFMNELIENYQKSLEEKVNAIYLNNYLKNLENGLDYCENLNLIETQYNLVIEKMETFIIEHGNISIVIDDKTTTVYNLLVDFKMYFANANPKISLLSQIDDGEFLKYTPGTDEANAVLGRRNKRISELRNLIANNDVLIAIYTANHKPNGQLEEEIIRLGALNAEYTNELKVLEKLIISNNLATTDFINYFNEIVKKISGFTESYNTILRNHMNNHFEVYYFNNNFLQTSGQINIILMGIVGCILGLFISLGTVWILNFTNKKQKNN